MFQYAGKVDIGVYEKQNDDRILIGSHLLTDGEFFGQTDRSYLVAAVCDGVGGMAEGYRAAMTTLEIFSHFNRAGVGKEEIIEGIEKANRRVRMLQCVEQLEQGLRSTIAGIYADESKFFVYNAGDSRVYRFRFKYLQQISRDHSFVQDLIDGGKITAEDARQHPQKNVINKCIGNAETVDARVVDLSDDFIDGDILLLCSDGICDVITEEEMTELLLSHLKDENLQDCCQSFFEKALENGALDNMSLILLRKGENETNGE